MTPFFFLPEADEDLSEAAAWYEEQSPGLGDEFLSEAFRAVELATSSPDIGAPYRKGTSRLLLRTFPFNLVYRQDHRSILFVAVAHQKRHPGYWRGRVRRL
ncbi:MAG: type II toxin-antitoxin system RelE/ParE family toxin [Deltaproteobacteria bacterium]|nr:type II toxin-antitoxin system RelE/ParE family toxin [Deltaproteobacteria bacterium]